MFPLSRGRYCHTIFCLLSPFWEGKCCPFFFFFICVFLWSGSCPLPFFGKVLFLLKVGLRDKFSGANFCFCFFCVLVFLVGICLCFSRIFLQFRPGSALKNSLHVRSCSLSRSLCLRVWVDDVVCCFSSFSFFSEEIQLRANRTPHTPPHVLLFFLFLFLSPPRLFVRLFWPCVLFVLGFLRGAILGPVRFLDSLGTPLRFFFGREAVEAFALFLVCCFSRFAAPHF